MRRYPRKVDQEKYDAIRDLKCEIILNPEMKHRIILKAIKNAKTKELARLIRNYNKKDLL
ncbi:MAG: hypothetical protein AAF693_20285 [Bacteroidota bacterium]